MVTLVFARRGARGGAGGGAEEEATVRAGKVCEDEGGRWCERGGSMKGRAGCIPAAEVTDAHEEMTVPDWCSRLVVPE